MAVCVCVCLCIKHLWQCVSGCVCVCNICGRVGLGVFVYLSFATVRGRWVFVFYFWCRVGGGVFWFYFAMKWGVCVLFVVLFVSVVWV